ncbi:uncharacterized protein METZ01_LOCUS403402, partial [marine metagenome]
MEPDPVDPGVGSAAKNGANGSFGGLFAKAGWPLLFWGGCPK